jgi:hypothetical protein
MAATDGSLFCSSTTVVRLLFPNVSNNMGFYINAGQTLGDLHFMRRNAAKHVRLFVRLVNNVTFVARTRQIGLDMMCVGQVHQDVQGKGHPRWKRLVP